LRPFSQEKSAFRPADKPQRIAHIVEADGARELRVKHRHHMAPGTESARSICHPGFPRSAADHKIRNPIANLPQDYVFLPLLRDATVPNSILSGLDSSPPRRRRFTTHKHEKK